MNIKKQIEEIAKYFKNNEKKEENLNIGAEFEHFVVDKNSLKAISYYGKDGIEETLQELLQKGWQGKYEGNYLLGLSRDGTTITLEPGSQIELSIKPHKNIENIESEYIRFINEIDSILSKKNQTLITTGYQPESKIDDIKIIPKNRYKYMYEYFKSKGRYAHNMMKGTASVQVSVDYKSEVDYAKKYKISSALSPVIYAIFDNSPFFEGKLSSKNCLRTNIWSNCDNDRCGIVYSAFDDSFGYDQYAEYILNVPPIFIDDGKNIIFTNKKLFSEIFNPNDYSLDELEHVLTMVFPDVRTKKYIEIRMMDAVPYPFNFAAVALWKGILYNNDNLDKVYKYVKILNVEDINKAKKDIIEKGLNARIKDKTIYEIAIWIIELSKEGLNEKERDYLLPLEKIIESKNTFSQITKNRIDLGKKEALKWCFINNKLKRGDELWML